MEAYIFASKHFTVSVDVRSSLERFESNMRRDLLFDESISMLNSALLHSLDSTIVTGSDQLFECLGRDKTVHAMGRVLSCT